MFILKKAEHSAEAFGEARPTAAAKKQTIYSSVPIQIIGLWGCNLQKVKRSEIFYIRNIGNYFLIQQQIIVYKLSWWY